MALIIIAAKKPPFPIEAPETSAEAQEPYYSHQGEELGESLQVVDPYADIETDEFPEQPFGQEETEFPIAPEEMAEEEVEPLEFGPQAEEEQAPQDPNVLNDLVSQYQKAPTNELMDRILQMPTSTGRSLINAIYSRENEQKDNIGTIVAALPEIVARYNPKKGDFEDYFRNSIKFETKPDDRGYQLDKYIRAITGTGFEDPGAEPPFLDELPDDYEKIRESYIWNEHEMRRSTGLPLAAGGKEPSRVEQAVDHWNDVIARASDILVQRPELAQFLENNGVNTKVFTNREEPAVLKGRTRLNDKKTDSPRRKRREKVVFGEANKMFKTILGEVVRERQEGISGPFTELANSIGLDSASMFIRPGTPVKGEPEDYLGRYFLNSEMLFPRDKGFITDKLIFKRSEDLLKGDVTLSPGEEGQRLQVSREEAERQKELGPTRVLEEKKRVYTKKPKEPKMPKLGDMANAIEAYEQAKADIQEGERKRDELNEKMKTNPKEYPSLEKERNSVQDKIHRDQNKLESFTEGRGILSKFRDKSPEDFDKKVQEIKAKLPYLKRERDGSSLGMDVLKDLAVKKDKWSKPTRMNELKKRIAEEFAKSPRPNPSVMKQLRAEYQDVLENVPDDDVVFPKKEDPDEENVLKQKFKIVAQDVMADLVDLLDRRFQDFKQILESRKAGQKPNAVSRFKERNALIKTAINGILAEEAVGEFFDDDDVRAFVARLILHGLNMDEVQKALCSKYPNRLEAKRKTSFTPMFIDVKGKLDKYLSGRPLDA